MFPLLGAHPMLGRSFLPEEGAAGADARTVILSHGLWQRRFGADSGILNRSITLNDAPWIVVGVMPPGFGLPGNTAELWSPLAPGEGSDDRGNRFLRVVGRLAPGGSLRSATDELNLIAARIGREEPASSNWSVTILGMTDAMLGEDFHSAVKILLGAVVLVLLIACSNVATMVLGRATARRRELAVRTALGAGRRRLARLLVTENILLGLGSSVLGIAVAAGLIRVLLGLQPAGLPRLDQTRVNLLALLVAIGLGLLIGLGFGLLPLTRKTGEALPAGLREGERGETGSRRRHRTQRLLVVAETALAVLLLSGAGLLVRSFLRLQQVDLGFDSSGVSAINLTLPESRYPGAARILGFYGELMERLRAVPGVESVSAINSLPLSGVNSALAFGIVGRALPPPGQSPDADFRSVMPGYFHTMGIRLIGGRDFTAQDDSTGSGVAIISATAARLYWSGANPVGSRIRIGDAATGPEALVIGVVADVRYLSLEREHRPLIYTSALRTAPRTMSLVTKSVGTPLSAEAVRRLVTAIDPAQAVAGIQEMDAVVDEVMAGSRFNVIVLGIFAAFALGLGVIGLYGVMAYAVVQRTRELGVRLALGAEPRRVLRMILGESLALTGTGILLGAVGALLLNRVLQNLLFGVQPNDPLALLIATLMLMGGGLAGGLLPARRAARVDPIETLKSD
jgi:putative ABC transport system permease protein